MLVAMSNTVLLLESRSMPQSIPDFGQVEADPATLNLSAYEEYF